MKLTRTITLVAASLFVSAIPSYAAKADKVVLSYRLPKATIGFALSHTITRCPDPSGAGFRMDVATAMKPVYVAGDVVKVNASGNPFVDREVKLEFYENGTLKSFNGTSAGQGGKVVVAGIKLASLIGSAAIGLPPVAPPAAPGVPVLQCHDWVKDVLASKASAIIYLKSLEGQVVAASLSDDLAAEITAARARIAALESLLTVTADRVYWTPSGKSLNLSTKMASGDLSVWFKSVSAEGLGSALAKAGYGQTQEFLITGHFDKVPAEAKVPTDSARSLLYLEPVVARVAMKPSMPFATAGVEPADLALAAKVYKASEQSAKVRVPQMGSLVSIPFDGSGIFGSRAVSASFSEAGELTSIGYTSKGGADALASVVDATTAAATELRDARLNNIKRDIELRTREKELEDLIDQEALEKP